MFDHVVCGHKLGAESTALSDPLVAYSTLQRLCHGALGRKRIAATSYPLVESEHVCLQGGAKGKGLAKEMGRCKATAAFVAGRVLCLDLRQGFSLYPAL